MPVHKEIANANILITGLARDVSNVIEREVLQLKEAFADFAKVSFFIVESDSVDGTAEKLRMLESRIENFQFLSLGAIQNHIPDRIARLAHCRQICADFVVTEKFDYVAVSDLDGTNSLLRKEAVQSCWMQTNWDACFANQRGLYYDIYALRHKEWCTQDYSQDIAFLESNGIHPMKARRMAVLNKQRKIAPDSSWIEVDSAFGGLGIYTAKCFSISKYDYIDSKTSRTICEHVRFHEGVRYFGGRLFINPQLINHEVKRYSSTFSFMRYLAQYLFSLFSPRLFRYWEESRSSSSNVMILKQLLSRNSCKK